MKKIISILALLAAVTVSENVLAAALPDCMSSLSYQGVCMDTNAQLYGGWYAENAVYCTADLIACAAKQSIDPNYANLIDGACYGFVCRYVGANFNSTLYGGYTGATWNVTPLPPPTPTPSTLGGFVDFSQVATDIQYVGVAAIVLSLIVISFLLVKKHLTAAGETREERIIERGRDVEAAWERAWDTDIENLEKAGVDTYGGRVNWETADREAEIKNAKERGMSVEAVREEKALYDAASKKYFEDPEAREAAGLDEPMWEGETDEKFNRQQAAIDVSFKEHLDRAHVEAAHMEALDVEDERQANPWEKPEIRVLADADGVYHNGWKK